MIKWYAKAAAALLTMSLATACINDDYDLSDVDTTTRITVNDLVIPANLDAVTIGDIITFDSNSKIQPVTINGKTFYALNESGHFESEEVEIEKVTATAPTLNPTEAWLNIVPAPAAQAADLTVTYALKEMGQDFSFNAGHIDDAIVRLDYIKANVDLGITFEALDAASVKHIEFADVVIDMPKGLDATCSTGSYDPATGVWTIPALAVNASKAEIKMTATGINLTQAGTGISANHTLTYNGQMRVKSGTVALTTDLSSLPETLHFRASYSVSPLEATAFDGRVHYTLDGLDINPITLNDIPDFLSGESTNIVLNNPQIYLSVNNPVANYSLGISSGLTLSALFDGNNRPYDYSPDNNNIEVGFNKGIDGRYNFVLAPEQSDLSVPSLYEDGLKYYQFSTLGQLLATPEDIPAAGLPKEIGIHLDNPQIPESDVRGFALGTGLTAFSGDYDLVAPLSLAADAEIVYTEREDGWNDEDVDAIVISKLSLTATATNACPLGVELFAWPIDTRGNRIQGVEIKSSYLEAGATDVPIVIEMTGQVEHLDGVIYEARVKGSNQSTALAPSQTITLSNIRARVSGYYEKEL